MEIGKSGTLALKTEKKTKRLEKLKKNILRDKYLLILVLPGILYYVIFHYLPLYGVTIAFKNYSIAKGIMGSDWVGLKWFMKFFNSYYFVRLVKNTFLLSVYGLAWGFPIPIIFALLLNELKNGPFKKCIQTVSYLPHFISQVVIVGILVSFLSPVDGIVNNIIQSMGYQPINFLSEPGWFRTLYIGSSIWKDFGWSSIIYLAALSNIDQEIYEASKIDGANRFKQMLHVTLPGIAPTIIILLLLNLGRIMSVGFEKVILMYKPVTYEVADIISTYVYRAGILNAEYSFASAVGVFNSVVNVCLLIIFNNISRKVSETSLW